MALMREIMRDGVTFEVRDDPDKGWDEFWTLWESRAWEPRSFDVIEEHAGKVFVDVGAWLGPLTLWAVRFYERIIAIEPDPVAREGLQDNLRASGLVDKVHIASCAIVAAPLEHAHITPVDRGRFGDSMTRLADRGVTVPSMTLPELLEVFHVEPEDVGLVKIDVEGYELTLMPVLAPWFALHRVPFQVAFHGVRPDLSAISETHVLEDSWVYQEWGDIVGRPR